MKPSVLAVLSLLALACSDARPDPPNIIYILADDLGYGDLGVYGQMHFATPNIDRLAGEGMRFTAHYSGSTVCAPSRDALLTGRHTGHTFVRGNKEIEPEGQHPLPKDTVTVAELLQKAGYRTGAIGKWGLGAPGTEGLPSRQGFDLFYGYNCQRQAHTYYPTHLWRNEDRVELEANEGGQRGLYSHDLLTDEALRFIRDRHERNDGPFFLFLPYAIPHAAIDVPEDSMGPYMSRFPEVPFPGRGRYIAQSHPKAAFAGMIERLDNDVGRITALVDELGLGPNTLLFFSSDNGPHLEGGADPDYFDSNGPFRGYKRDLYDGGIRVPLIARWTGTVTPGSVSDHISAFWDVLPTLVDVATGEAPTGGDGISFLPELLGEPQREHDFLYWEFHEQGGKQAIRLNGFKGVRTGLDEDRNAPIELYDIENDPGETSDISSAHADVVTEMARILSEVRTPSADFPFPLDP